MVGSAIAQVFVIFLFICSSDGKILDSLIDTCYLSRVVLAIIGLLQLSRKQVSFYHGMVLSNLCQLLGIPLYLTLALDLATKKEDVYVWVVRIMNILGALIAVIINLFLTIASVRLGTLDGYCTSNDGNGTMLLESPTGYGTWIKAYQRTIIYILADIAFIFFTWRNRRRNYELPENDSQEVDAQVGTAGVRETIAVDAAEVERREFEESSENRSDAMEGQNEYERFDGLQILILLGGLVFAFSVTLSLLTAVMGLNSVADESQRSWGFGQMVALASTSIPICSSLLQFCMSPGRRQTDPRYLAWYKVVGLLMRGYTY